MTGTTGTRAGEAIIATGDYTKQIHISATPEKVFGTLTTAAEFASWWAPATGSASEAGELRITFEGIEDPLKIFNAGGYGAGHGLLGSAMPGA